MEGHYSAIAAVSIAVAVIVTASVLAHAFATASLYGAPVAGEACAHTLNGSGADQKVLQDVKDWVHEGARWHYNAHCEATVWAIVLVVLLVVVLGYGFWKEVLSGKRR